jgi:glutamate dehydrogenase (NADP+)
MLSDHGQDLAGQTAVISGSGNVAIYACEKAQQYGAKVVAMSDSDGYIHDQKGIDLKLIKQLKEVERKRIKEYKNFHPEAEYNENYRGIWNIKCDLALPCATQNEINEQEAGTLIEGGVIAVAEGANMPSTNEAVRLFLEHKVLFGPAKAANAGGVATSALEMCQNSMRLAWSFEEVDQKLHGIMVNIYRMAKEAAREYGMDGNYVAGANISGFQKVAASMLAQGIY